MPDRLPSSGRSRKATGYSSLRAGRSSSASSSAWDGSSIIRSRAPWARSTTTWPGGLPTSGPAASTISRTPGPSLGTRSWNSCWRRSSLLGVWIWQRSVVPALFLALVTCGIGGIYYVAVNVDPRQRPPVEILDPGLVPDPQLPVGPRRHGYCVVRRHRRPDVDLRTRRPLVGDAAAPGPPLVVLVARLYQGAHHLSDVLTSLVFASVWLGTVAALLLRGRSRRSPRHRTVAS